MEKVTHINDFIRSLPKIRKRRVWSVIINGTVVQGVSATDNRKETAHAYIASKYPNQEFTLKFSHWKIWSSPPLGGLTRREKFGRIVDREREKRDESS